MNKEHIALRCVYRDTGFKTISFVLVFDKIEKGPVEEIPFAKDFGEAEKKYNISDKFTWYFESKEEGNEFVKSNVPGWENSDFDMEMYNLMTYKQIQKLNTIYAEL